LNLVVGQKFNTTVGGDMQERVEGSRESVAADSQRIVAQKTWIGSDSLNVLQLVCELLDLVRDMNNQLAEHTHGAVPVPNNSEVFKINADMAKLLNKNMISITF